MISPLGNGEPMGTHPAPALHGDAPGGFEALTTALSKLGDTPTPLTDAAVDRIESRIFAEAIGSTAVIDRFEVLSMPQVQEPDLDLWEEELSRESSQPKKARPGRLMVGAAAGCLAAILISWLAFAGAGKAQPDSLLYPVKLRLEQLKLNRAAPGIPTGRAHLEIATTRFQELRDLRRGTPNTLKGVADRMDRSGSRALSIATTAPESPERIELLSDLLALALSQNRFLHDRLPLADPSVLAPLARSYANSSRIIRETSSLLAAYGRSPSLATFNDAIIPVLDATPAETGSRSSYAAPAAPSPTTGPGPGAPVDEPPPPPEAPCDLEGGEICVRIPTLDELPTEPPVQ